MKIAVGIDVSVESERAAWQAVELARHVGGEVVLVHVAESVGVSPPGPRTDVSLHAAMETYRQAVTRSLEWARGHLAEMGERLSGRDRSSRRCSSRGCRTRACAARPRS